MPNLRYQDENTIMACRPAIWQLDCYWRKANQKDNAKWRKALLLALSLHLRKRARG
jgi:hypothetical protein